MSSLPQVPPPHVRPLARLAPVLAVVGAAALFGTTGTAQALGPSASTGLGVGAVRLAVGALALALLAGARRPSGGRRWGVHLRALCIGGVAVALYQLCWFAGLRRTGVALGTIVGIGSGPVFAGVLHLWRHRDGLPRAWIAGTAVTVAGSALLALRGAGGVSIDPTGLAFMAAAGLSYAVYTVAAKDCLDGGLDARGAMAGIFGVGALVTAPLLLTEPLGWLGTPGGLAMTLHLGVLTIGLAYWLYGFGLSHLPAPVVVTLTLAEPLTAATLGVAVLGERFGSLGIVGAALVAAGLVIAGGAERTEPGPSSSIAVA
jgi:DME family drug/metabolite transporter